MTDQSMQIRQIEQMEEILNALQEAEAVLNAAISRYQELLPKRKLLMEYYESEQWQKDTEDDADQLFPETLRRGVLSEDAVYDMMSEQISLQERLRQLADEMELPDDDD